MEPFERLDRAMNHRRLELGMNWRQLAEAARISYTALRAIRRGEYRPTELTAQAVDDALHWVRGSVLAVLDGGEPTILETHPPSDRRVELRESEAAASSSLPSRDVDLLADLTVTTAERLGLTPAQMEEAFRRALRDVEARRTAEVRGEDPPQAPRRAG